MKLASFTTVAFLMSLLISGALSNTLAMDSKGRYFALGAGSRSCTDYIKFREKRLENFTPEQYDITKVIVEHWVAGYLTAHNFYVMDTYDVVGTITMDQLEDRMEKFCRANQSKSILARERRNKIRENSDRSQIIFKERYMQRILTTVLAISLAIFFFGCSEPLTTREKGAGIGTLTGAGLGGIIGAATGHAGAGAGIGAALGLVGGALIGDQMQARQKQDQAVQQQLSAQQAEIQRQNQELQQLKQQQQR